MNTRPAPVGQGASKGSRTSASSRCMEIFLKSPWLRLTSTAESGFLLNIQIHTFSPCKTYNKVHVCANSSISFSLSCAATFHTTRTWPWMQLQIESSLQHVSSKVIRLIVQFMSLSVLDMSNWLELSSLSRQPCSQASGNSFKVRLVSFQWPRS